MKGQNNKLAYIFNVLVIILFTLMSGCAGIGGQWSIQNPYADVDWENHQRHKANFHTHTTRSDGRETPEKVIDRYAGLGYSILSLTDHDTYRTGRDRSHPEKHKTTWPWTVFNRNPDAIGMVAVEGNEISRRHHIGSYFNDYGDANVRSENRALEEIGSRGGLAVFLHPGRYRKSLQWYVDMYRYHPHLIGLEIFNQGDRYPKDRRTWDAILTSIIHERPVWGFSNDDMHDPEVQLGRNWNIMLLPELSAEWVRKAMEQGTFFYVYQPDGPQGEPPPEIKSITVDSSRGIIHLQTTAYGRIAWISRGSIVHDGPLIELSKIRFLDAYLRVEVYGADQKSLVGTQPFRIHRKPTTNTVTGN